MAFRPTIYRNRLVSFLARAIARKYEPGIIAVTGAIGKTSTQEALYTILRELRDVRASSPDFTNNMHAPLGILGEWKNGSGFFFWLNVIITGCVALITKQDYPELLILEYNPEPRFLRRMLGIAHPHIVVVTALPRSSRISVSDVAPIIETIRSNSYCIFNYDDPTTRELKELTRAHIMTFGFNEGAAMRVTHLEYRAEERINTTHGKPLGISFKLEYGEHCIPIRLDGAFGKAPVYALAAAACVGVAFGLNLTRIAETTQYYRTPPHRMQLIPGKKGTYIFDDTAGATVASLEEALETISMIPASRTINVIGTMRAIDEESYATLIQQAAKKGDMLFLVGDTPTIDKKNAMRFDTAEQALAELQAVIERGDVILVTGLNTESIVHGLSSHRLVA